MSSQPPATHTTTMAWRLIVKDELGFLYMKKQKLYENLYNIHLDVVLLGTYN